MPLQGACVPLFCAVLLHFAATPAFAQLPPAGTRVPEPQPQLRPAPGFDIQLQGPPLPQPAITGTVTVTRFRFSGATAIGAAELDSVVAPWIGRELSASELAEAVGAVTRHLGQRGLFVAYAHLPDQQITSGEVEIRIVEGVVGTVAIEIADGARLKRSVAEQFLSRLEPGAPIERGIFDTPLLLLNDLPGVRVTPMLVTGSAPGTADVTVKVEDERIAAGYLRVDNHETRELGEYQLTGSLRLRNPTGLGDLLTAQVAGTHTGGRKRGALSYSLPVNRFGTRVGVLYGEQRYRIGGAFEPLRASGDSTSVGLLATHPLLRTHDRNLIGALALNEIDYQDRVDAIGFSSDTRHSFATVVLAGDLADQWLGGGRSVAYLEYQWGDVALDTSSPAVANALGLGPQGSFERARARVDRIQSIGRDTSLRLSLTMQAASRNLAAGREMTLSGPDGVRAYPVEELLVDEGYLARVEYRHALPSTASWRWHAAGFFDHARGKINKEPLAGVSGNTRTISGYGVSLEVAVKKFLSAQATLAWRAREAPLTDPDRNPRAWFVLTQSF